MKNLPSKTYFLENQMPDAFQYLITAENVLLSPHVGGWTIESKKKLAQTIVDKIKATVLPFNRFEKKTEF